MEARVAAYVNKSYKYGFNGKEGDVESFSQCVAFEARIYDSRLGKFLSRDPLENLYTWQSTYVFAHNSPIALIDWLGMGDPPKDESMGDSELELKGEGSYAWDGGYSFDATTDNEGLNEVAEYTFEQSCEAGMPWWLERGQAAHNAFTAYIERNGNPLYIPDKPVGWGSLVRPDLIYRNEISGIGGVWELKPGPPSPSSALAYPQVIGYTKLLNNLDPTVRYGHGSSNGAPDPFNGKTYMVLTDPVTQKKFYFCHGVGPGTLWYFDVRPGDLVREPIREPKPKLQPQPIPQYDYKRWIKTPALDPIPSPPIVIPFIPAGSGVGAGAQSARPIPVVTPSTTVYPLFFFQFMFEIQMQFYGPAPEG